MKNRILLILFFGTLFVSCLNQENSSKNEGSPQVSFRDSVTLTPEQILYYNSFDIIYTSTFSYRGLQFNNKLKDLLKISGTPDSIVDPHYECGYLSEVKTVVYYYKDVLYDVYNDKAAVNEVDFRKTPIKISYKFGTLSSETTVSQIKRLFPKSFAKLSSDANDKGNISIRLFAEPMTDEFIDLTFVDGKLVSLSTWSDC